MQDVNHLHDLVEGGELIIWASAEISATIIAASVPVLRTLVKGLSTARYGGRSDGYFQSGSVADNHRSRGPRSNIPNVVTVTAHDKRANTSVSPDGSSDRSILDNTPGKIMRTEEIAISFADRGDEASLNYEMHDLEGMNRQRK